MIPARPSAFVLDFRQEKTKASTFAYWYFIELAISPAGLVSAFDLSDLAVKLFVDGNRNTQGAGLLDHGA